MLRVFASVNCAAVRGGKLCENVSSPRTINARCNGEGLEPRLIKTQATQANSSLSIPDKSEHCYCYISLECEMYIQVVKLLVKCSVAALSHAT